MYYYLNENILPNLGVYIFFYYGDTLFMLNFKLLTFFMPMIFLDLDFYWIDSYGLYKCRY